MMKYLIAFFGITACLVVPLSAQNTPGNTRDNAPVVRIIGKPNFKGSVVPAKARVVYYITTASATGSHIPLVVRRYQGKNTALGGSSPGRDYSLQDAGITGSSDVGSALAQLDPAVSSASHR